MHYSEYIVLSLQNLVYVLPVRELQGMPALSTNQDKLETHKPNSTEIILITAQKCTMINTNWIEGRCKWIV